MKLQQNSADEERDEEESNEEPELEWGLKPLMGYVVVPKRRREFEWEKIHREREERERETDSNDSETGTRAQNSRSQSTEVTTMNNFIPLESVKVATPCRADWDKMQGDDHARFCGSCAKNVYNLSEMTREDAERLIQEKEGHLCARFYQRADGTMITADCPVGITQRRRPFWALTAGFAALMASGVAVFGGSADASTPMPHVSPSTTWRDSVEQWRDVPVLGFVVSLVSPTPTPPPMVMGKIACPPRIPVPAPTPAEPDGEPVMGDIMISPRK